MKKTLFLTMFLALSVRGIYGQSLSRFNVKYMISFDTEKKVYTAWVIPEYDTPNYNNADTEEKGATAQFTLKVPRGFILSNLKDIRGVWDKAPVKLGSEAVFAGAGLSQETDFYIIGKAPTETNYGIFRRGEPVALFSFTGTMFSEQVQPLAANDSFIRIADKTLSLNVGNSFYSKSGQRPSPAAKPLEQFYAPTQLQKVMDALSKNLGVMTETGETTEENQVIAYPNPVKGQLTVRFFSPSEGIQAKVDLFDAVGIMRQSHSVKTKTGINTVYLQMGGVPNGAYMIRTQIDKKAISKKVVKIE